MIQKRPIFFEEEEERRIIKKELNNWFLGHDFIKYNLNQQFLCYIMLVLSILNYMSYLKRDVELLFFKFFLYIILFGHKPINNNNSTNKTIITKLKEFLPTKERKRKIIFVLFNFQPFPPIISYCPSIAVDQFIPSCFLRLLFSNRRHVLPWVCRGAVLLLHNECGVPDVKMFPACVDGRVRCPHCAYSALCGDPESVRCPGDCRGGKDGRGGRSLGDRRRRRGEPLLLVQ